MLASVYSLVDMAMVGQYQGPDGAAALAVVAPVWNIIYSLGLLTGIGGSVLSSTHRGQGKRRQANQAFTVALGFTVILAAASWLGLIFFEVPLLRFFGGDEALIPLARDLFVPGEVLGALLPLYPDAGGLSPQRWAAGPGHRRGPVRGRVQRAGGLLFCLCPGLGYHGGGHCHLPGGGNFLPGDAHPFPFSQEYPSAGAGQGMDQADGPDWRDRVFRVFADIAMGILTILFNRQIMHFLGTDALAVYGVLVNVSTLVQCCAYSVGQASQPLSPSTTGPADQTDFGCPAVCLGDGGGLWGAVGVGAGRVSHGDCPAVHGADPGGPGGSPGHFADVWAVLFAAAVQYLFCLLFPVYSSAGQCLWNLCHPRPGGQRGSHSHLAALWGGSAIWLAMPLTELVVALAVAGLMGVRSVRQLKGEL